jgi:DNA-binding beta-propeller fold protein YncE
MKTSKKMLSLGSVFILLALLISGAMIVHGTAFAAEETFTKTSVIQVPGGLSSFDIGFVDPQLGLYFLADRTNRTIDQVKTSDNSITQLAQGKLVGANGVITANDHKEVWAADSVDPQTGTSSVKVISLATGDVKSIDTFGLGRSDELCEDPQNHVVLVANDAEVDSFLTFISTKTYKILGTLHLDGTDRKAQNVHATNGIEQCQWSPRTGKFYLAIPEVAGTVDGTNTVPGAVLEINPESMKVQKVFAIDFGFVAAHNGTPATADCLGPQGLAIGPHREILLGCSNAGAGSVIINELDGDLVRNVPGLNGNDEVWYNPGDNHYFLAGGNHTPPILGVADQRGDNAIEDAGPTTLGGSHSVAADPIKNQVYVPINGSRAGANAICGAGVTGCIAVFTAAANDDPGICGGRGERAHGEGEEGDPGFKRHVCPNNNGHPNEHGDVD